MKTFTDLKQNLMQESLKAKGFLVAAHELRHAIVVAHRGGMPIRSIHHEGEHVRIVLKHAQHVNPFINAFEKLKLTK